MVDLRVIWPPALAVLLSVLVFGGIARVDDAAQAARNREAQGLNRGSFVDDHGKVLATTVDVSGKSHRVYALPSLAPLVGYRDPTGSWRGLESRFGGLLEGARAQRDWRTYFLHLRGQSVQGDTVRMTIDRRLQAVADDALGKIRGAAVAIDPRTGSVLALVSKPYCAPPELESQSGFSRCNHDPNRPMEDRALDVLFVPGSTFKIVTLSAALDSGRFHLSDVFSGADAFGPSPYFDNVLYPSNVTRSDLTQLTLPQALAFSDNFTFAHIGLTLGAQTLLRYAHRFYIDRRIPFDYPVAVSRIAAGQTRPSMSVLAQSSFGGDVDTVSPLQMALIVSAVANHGVLMAPHLIQNIRDASGRVVYRYRIHALSHVTSSAAAAKVTSAMTFVVDHGSGYQAQIPGIKVAGKTGTASSGATVPHAWFIAFAPANHPIVAVAVLHEFSGEGFKYAAPIARRILVAALRERGLRAH